MGQNKQEATTTLKASLTCIRVGQLSGVLFITIAASNLLQSWKISTAVFTTTITNTNNNNNNPIQRHNLRFLQSVCNIYAQAARVQSYANYYHMQHVMLCATWYKGAAQLLSLTEFKSHLFSFNLLAETIHQWKRGGNRSTWRKPLMTSFRKYHILKPENSSPNRDLNPNFSIGDGHGKQTC